MEPGTYRIEVLHHLNPHLIWVEHKGKRDFILEQIGVVGILPIASTINENNEVVSGQSDSWIPASNQILREWFELNREVYFTPVHIDRRSSIFDENVHIFGQIFTRVRGKNRYLADHIVNSGFAHHDEGLFYQKLFSGAIKTKLTVYKTHVVVTAIEKYYEYCKQKQNAVKSKTSIFHSLKQVGHDLTEKNLEYHSSDRATKIDNLSKIIDRKTKDFDMCKEEDEIPLGRGYYRQHSSKYGSTVSDHSKSDSLTEHTKYDSPETYKTYDSQNTNRHRAKHSPETEHSNYKSILKHSKDMRHNDSNYDNRQKVEQPYIKRRNSADHRQQQRNDWKYSTSSRKKYDNYDFDDRDIRYEHKDRRYDHKNNQYEQKQSRYSHNDSHFGQKKDRSPKDGRKSFRDFETAADEDYGFKGVKKLVEPVNTKYDLELSDNTLSDEEDQAVTKKTNFPKKLPKKTYVAFGPPMNDRIKYQIKTSKNEIMEVPQKNNEKKMEEYKTEDKDDFDDTWDDKDSNLEIDPTWVNTSNNANATTNNIVTKPELTVKTDETIKPKISSVLQHRFLRKKDSNNNSENINETEAVPIKVESYQKIERSVNPFKNLDAAKSIFVDKLISPIVMVHTKNDNLVLPYSNIRDIPFKSEIITTLKNIGITKPSRLQTISWPYILRGHSVFMISPASTGKTLGYVPAICNLVIDDLNDTESGGPICVIICATAKSVCNVTALCKLFLNLEHKVLACFQGLDFVTLSTAILNGCDILVTTPPMLYLLLQNELGVDLRRLTTLVLDDCERISQVYDLEFKVIQSHVKEMLKNRANKQVKVQYVVASRQWYDFLRPLAKKVPDTIISITSFQECVMYSKTNTSVVLKDNKIDSVIDFLNNTDRAKRTVIVCRNNEEVDYLEKCLSKMHTIFACNNNMTAQDLFNMAKWWATYEEPLMGPILVCCDGNLTQLNITDASYLIHYSMPQSFSMFCKRFAVLNDNYASIFGPEKDVKIKILLDHDNIEQIPKILNFIKRCTSEVPEVLEEVSRQVMGHKDLAKAKKLIPVCDCLLTLSECNDRFDCQERHAILKEFDEPQEWVPREGIVTFKILHYDTAVSYSARILSHTTNNGTTRFPTTYSTLSIKMGMYYSKEANRRLHGEAKIGDFCAFAVMQNLYARCQVLKIIKMQNGKPHHLLIKLIDEEQLETVRDVYLYHLPEELKSIQTYVVKVKLSNIQPKDRDVTYSDLALSELKKKTDKETQLYLRGTVLLTVGNTIFVDKLEACEDLTALNSTIVKHDIKSLLIPTHAEENPDHIDKLKKLCEKGNLTLPQEKEVSKIAKKEQKQRNCRWAYISKHEENLVEFADIIDPSKFFVRLVKFQKEINLLVADMNKYVKDNPKPLQDVAVGDIVLAECPDDKTFERARIEKVLDNKVQCFFVDNGDFLDVALDKLNYIPDKFIEQIPFQAIECRLIGVAPASETWSEFSTKWLEDACLTDSNDSKQLYTKMYLKEPAEITGGKKYAVKLIDTNSGKDVHINKMMIELNLGRAITDEIAFVDEPFNREPEKNSDITDDEEENLLYKKNVDKSIVPFKELEDKKDLKEVNTVPLKTLFPAQPIRSVPLVSDDVCIEECDVNLSGDFANAIGLSNVNAKQFKLNDFDKFKDTSSSDGEFGLPMIENKEHDLEDDKKNSNDDNKGNDISKDDLFNKINDEVLDSSDDESFLALKNTLHRKYSKAHLFNYKNGSKNYESKNNDSKNDADQIEDPNIILDTEPTDSSAPIFNLFAKSHRVSEKNNNKIMIHSDSLIKDVDKNTQVSQSSTDSSRNSNKKHSDLDSDDFSSTAPSHVSLKSSDIDFSKARSPKIIWKQNKVAVTIKIMLIGVEKYYLEILDTSLKFFCEHNDQIITTIYGFQIELYGIIDSKISSHSNKGQYLLVVLNKTSKRNWLNLTKDCKIKKWIAYDFDSIDTSSEEEEVNDISLKHMKQTVERNDIRDSDDDDSMDDVTYGYTRED